jgi:hypothetical protein
LNYNNCSTDWPFPLTQFIAGGIVFIFKITEKINNNRLRNTRLFPHGIIRPVVSVSALA